MKNKIIGVLSIISMMLLLCSCGGNKDTELEKNSYKDIFDLEENSDVDISDTEEIEESKLSIGETLEVSIFDFTITNIQFTQFVESIMNEDFLLPTDHAEKYFYGVDGNKYENHCYPEDGYVLLAFTISLKHTGKKNYTGMLDNIFNLEYGDGYTFDVKEMYIQQNGKWIFIDGNAVNHQSVNFKVLDDTVYTIRGYYEVPEEVKANTDEPLKINITGLGKDASYIIR